MELWCYRMHTASRFCHPMNCHPKLHVLVPHQSNQHINSELSPDAAP